MPVGFPEPEESSLTHLRSKPYTDGCSGTVACGGQQGCLGAACILARQCGSAAPPPGHDRVPSSTQSCDHEAVQVRARSESAGMVGATRVARAGWRRKEPGARRIALCDTARRYNSKMALTLFPAGAVRGAGQGPGGEDLDSCITRKHKP